MIKKHLVVFGLVLSLVLAIPVLANVINTATGTADCLGFTLSLSAIDLTIGTPYEIDYTLTLTCGASVQVISGNVKFTATTSSQTEPASGNWPTSPLTASCTVIGTAFLTANPSVTIPITINGSASASLPCQQFDERMTGGGSFFQTPPSSTTSTSNTSNKVEVDINGGTDPTGRVTHGFEIHCGAPPPKPDTLEVNWGPGHRFHLETLISGVCTCDTTILGPSNPNAGFNTFTGAGTGKLDGVDGASITFVFTDQGEPGTNDTVVMTIFDPLGNVVLSIPLPTDLTFGNQQAHRQGGPKVPQCLGNGGA